MPSNPWTHYRAIYGSTGDSNLDNFLLLIPHTTHKTRKSLMSCARARCFPVFGTRLHQQVWPHISRFLLSLPYCKDTMQTILSSYMLSGFFLSALLSAPYDDTDISTIKGELMWKEVSVMESTPRKASIDWTEVLGKGSLHVDLKPSPNTNMRVRRSLRAWIARCQSSVLYPAMGHRSVSTQTRHELEDLLCQVVESNIDVTSTTIEHAYSRYGVLLGGECEMKQKWYPTQASPRTYYAQGGRAYNSSKYLRDPINWLCDLFYPTNRFSRVSPSGIRVNENYEDVVIYDLTSFTSLFHEQWAFLTFLAHQTQDVQVQLFDSWNGLLTVSLGQLILEYLHETTLQPQYYTHIQQLSSLKLHHSVAGFLGVFGNLMTCTFPHGILLSTVMDNPDECWCAGDDAGTKERLETNGSETISMCSLLGQVSDEKTFRASEVGALALKRPIGIHGGILYLHSNIIWPVFAIMTDNDPRYYDPMHRTPIEKISGALVSFFRSCQTVPLTPSDIEFAYTFLESFYRKYQLPVSGWYPPLTGFSPWSFTIPRIDRNIFGKNPLHVLVDSFFGTEYISGLVEDCPWERQNLAVGDCFACNSEQHLNYLFKLGFLTKTPIMCCYPGQEGVFRAKLDIDHPQHYRLMYEFCVIEEIPRSLQLLS